MTHVEFWLSDPLECVANIETCAVPRKGELVNIKKTDYKVWRVDWSLDYAGSLNQRIRANVMLHLKK